METQEIKNTDVPGNPLNLQVVESPSLPKDIVHSEDYCGAERPSYVSSCLQPHDNSRVLDSLSCTMLRCMAFNALAFESFVPSPIIL